MYQDLAKHTRTALRCQSLVILRNEVTKDLS